MAGSDPWARVVWVVERWSQEARRFVWDSAWTDEAAARARAKEVGGGCVAAPLDPPAPAAPQSSTARRWRRCVMADRGAASFTTGGDRHILVVGEFSCRRVRAV